MLDVRVALANIVDRVLDIYNTNEGRVVKKMRLKYVNIIIAIFSIIYQNNKVQYFSNKSTMMITKVNHGKFVNQASIMYYQSIKQLIRWEKCHNNMIEGTTKREPKNDVCHFAIVLEALFQKWFPLQRAKSQEKKQIKQP